MKKMQCPNKGYMFVVDVDGKHSLLRLEPMNLRLNQIQEVLGGYFQIITYNQNIGLLVDEDGLNKNLPKNSFFSDFFGKVCVINLSDLSN